MKCSRIREQIYNVNMKTEETIYLALENLRTNTQIQGKWEHNAKENGCHGKLKLNIADEVVLYNVELKDELRNQQLQKVIEDNIANPPIMVVANRIFPKIKEQLRMNNIAYLEANGNIYLRNKGITLWIDTNAIINPTKKTETRAFTKTGLKVVFQFLMDETWLNKPYRQIAEHTGTGIGNITNITNGLKHDGFLLNLNKYENILQNKKGLFDKWVQIYEEKLKPTIKIGTFRFLNQGDFVNWRQINLQEEKTYWGAEPAADILTNYLKPQELTIYTTETRNELIKNYKLIPDETGNVKAYYKFWNDNDNHKQIVPPLLIYADLININDRRCLETAKKIYDAYLQNKL